MRESEMVMDGTAVSDSYCDTGYRPHALVSGR